jgi:long-subunit acyl-CoA synthetase (AMP-forming)
MRSGHVGVPLPCNLIKLVDVAEMDYFAQNGEGEVCFKGPNVFKGYYKDEEKTREALDEEGWLHSGDIGRWNENGTLTITDRKKHIFKLSQGEYVAPEKVENVYCRSPLVAQAYVHGNSLQDSCVAIIVPDEEELALWAKRNNVPGEFDDLCSNAVCLGWGARHLAGPPSDKFLYLQLWGFIEIRLSVCACVWVCAGSGGGSQERHGEVCPGWRAQVL